MGKSAINQQWEACPSMSHPELSGTERAVRLDRAVEGCHPL
jgi:hypothetical protein